ncbi:MAG: hypothetical protein ABIP75_02880 [Pyrinomonadaceae bacterium]
MSKIAFALGATILVAIAIAAPRGTKADEPVLIKATFFSHTNDDNKDHDTGIYVKVRTADGSSMIAHADNRDNSGDDGTEYKDYSDHQFDLDLDAAGISKSDASKFRVQVCQHTHGHDTWKMNGRVVLYFSNKTNLVASQDGVTMENDGACVDFVAQ